MDRIWNKRPFRYPVHYLSRTERRSGCKGKGTKPEYIVYNEEDERGTSYRDDRPGGTSIWWQAHLFTPIQSDYRSIKRKMREMLLAAGFGVGAVRTLYEKETEIVHVVISCNIVEHMEE